MMIALYFVAAVVLLLIFSMLNVLKEYERGEPRCFLRR